MRGRPSPNKQYRRAQLVISLLNKVALCRTPEQGLVLAILCQAVKDLPTHSDAKEFFVSGRFRSLSVRVGLDPDFVVSSLQIVGLLRRYKCLLNSGKFILSYYEKRHVTML